ncbi:MAG: GGDEF domain-containing protein [Lachnospiraceae bacterium]|nr:GGDEF domain-containing protein [Lachnospiraceae bacterium]
MKMTVELFDSIINTSQDCVFWKDKERRFLGVNQAFLDFYGFESADILIGKTDEEMGWHSDPEPFKRDELRVLAGRSTYKVQGKCMVRDEERDIIASKRPLYDGDEVIGLVGSFVDITDVLRRSLGDSKVLYTIDILRKYSYFDKLVDEVGLNEITDPLTGVLSRPYVVKFVHSLIEEQRPFTFSMIDLDNFKYINDYFGHEAGDKVLTVVASKLAKYTEDFGLVGRFGGDEFLLIDLLHTSREEKDGFFEKLYKESGALSVNVEFDNGSSFIAATTGAASFPYDADSFDDLFGKIDKMLYLGKSVGRNCYKIYDNDKHRDIKIINVSKYGVYTSMSRIRALTEEAEGITAKLTAVAPLITEILLIDDIYFIDPDGVMHAVNNSSFSADAGDIGKLMVDDVFNDGSLDRVQKESPVFYSVLMEHCLGLVMVTRIRKQNEIKGYLVCAAKRNNRIWQENECAILYYLAGLLSDE